MALEFKGSECLAPKDRQLKELAEREKAKYEQWAAERGEGIRTFRRAILYLTPDALIWMGSGQFKVVQYPLPSDAKMVSAFYDQHKNLFGILLESQEFEEVREGAILPTLPPPMIERLR